MLGPLVDVIEERDIAPAMGTLKERLTKLPLPKAGKIRRYLISSAQNVTRIEPTAWANFQALAKHYKAKIILGAFTYNRGAGTSSPTPHQWAKKIVPHIKPEPLQLAPGLLFLGHLNIRPTFKRPLASKAPFTGLGSIILPHAKIAVESIPSPLFNRTPMLYTTGTITEENYIPQNAGQVAEFHHTIGALLVEVDSAGRWFVRQVVADKTGTICDLDLIVRGAKVLRKNRVLILTPGDIHARYLNQQVAAVTWGKGGMLDYLRPSELHVHDLYDGAARNHHDKHNPAIRQMLHVEGWDSVEDELRGCVKVLEDMARPWCRTYVVHSNHDEFMEKWLEQEDGRRDPVNVVLFHELYAARARAIRDKGREGLRKFRALPYAMGLAGCPGGVEFGHEDESRKVGGIECSQHGHNLLNGRRAGKLALSQIAGRHNYGHIHAATWIDGAVFAGVCADPMPYEKGNNARSLTHILTYQTGKRALVTLWQDADGSVKWRA